MNRYVIINSTKKSPPINVQDAEIFKTEHAGQAVDFIKDICTKDPDAEIHIYGGDGSVFEAVNAVMGTPYPKQATIVVHPFGTGNDFARNFNNTDNKSAQQIDLIRFNDKYAANEINVGFDCDVVVLTHKLKKKPLIKGSAAYMISVLLTLFKRMGKDFDLTYTDEFGNVEALKSKLLLCLVANGGYYGGGFHCAPRAALNDGLLEFIYVKKISRLKFLSFFLGYQKGKHINDQGTLHSKYAPFLGYKRIRSITMYNVGNICADGEIFCFDTLTISVENQAVRIRVEPSTK